MSRVEFLIAQLIEARSFVNRLIAELPENLWFTIPEHSDSNFAWQIGHLIVSQNFHAITCITGRNEKIFELIPVIDYVKLFNGMGTKHRSAEGEIISAAKLREQLPAVHNICLESLGNLSDDELYLDLEHIPFKHPVAKTKYEALSWCFKHEMWHAAEMEAIKAALGYPIAWMGSK